VIDWVSGFDPATSSNLSPVLRRGTHAYVRIHGRAFDYPVQVSLGQGVTVQSTSVGSQDVFVAVNVAPGAALGARNVIVNDQGTVGNLAIGTFQLCHACITIAAA
jgi:hypothetical protein